VRRPPECPATGNRKAVRDKATHGYRRCATIEK
jgi:hypothetical protein